MNITLTALILCTASAQPARAVEDWQILTGRSTSDYRFDQSQSPGVERRALNIPLILSDLSSNLNQMLPVLETFPTTTLNRLPFNNQIHQHQESENFRFNLTELGHWFNRLTKILLTLKKLEGRAIFPFVLPTRYRHRGSSGFLLVPFEQDENVELTMETLEALFETSELIENLINEAINSPNSQPSSPALKRAIDDWSLKVRNFYQISQSIVNFSLDKLVASSELQKVVASALDILYRSSDLKADLDRSLTQQLNNVSGIRGDASFLPHLIFNILSSEKSYLSEHYESLRQSFESLVSARWTLNSEGEVGNYKPEKVNSHLNSLIDAISVEIQDFHYLLFAPDRNLELAVALNKDQRDIFRIGRDSFLNNRAPQLNEAAKAFDIPLLTSCQRLL